MLALTLSLVFASLEKYLILRLKSSFHQLRKHNASISANTRDLNAKLKERRGKHRARASPDSKCFLTHATKENETSVLTGQT